MRIMKVKQTYIEDDRVQLEATATAREVDDALQVAHIAFAQQMGLTPVPGKTVAEVAQERMGVKDLDSIVTDQVLATLGLLAVDKKGIMPMFPPQTTPKGKVQRGHDLELAITVTPKLSYELSSYEPLDLEAHRLVEDESKVDEELKAIAGTYAMYVRDEEASADPERGVKAGDIVKIALEARENGELMKGLSTEGRTYSVGQGYMPTGFDEAIEGMRMDEERSFSFEGPSFDESFNETTQTVDAKVRILEFQKEELPEIDDEWVKTTMPLYKDLASLKAEIRKQLRTHDEQEYAAYLRNLAADAVQKRFEGSIPDEAYEAARDSMMRNMQASAAQQGKAWDEFVQENGGPEQFNMMMMIEIRRMLVQGFTLDAVFRHFGLSIDDDDLEMACQMMNPAVDPRQMRQQMEKSGHGFALREAAERLKANQYLVESANISYLD